MNYILSGDSKDVAKVIQENRIRVDRGVVSFTPYQPETALDNDAIETLIESHDAITKDCQRMAVAQHELAEIIREILASAIEHGCVISEDLASRLDKFGITVPKIEETAENPALAVPENDEMPQNEADSVPETVENELMEDSKDTDSLDMTEVNLDDIKVVSESDNKDLPEATPKKKTRTKKSE